MSGNPAPVIDWVRDAAVTGTARQNRSTGANGFFVKSYFEQSDVTWLYHDKQITCKGTNQGGTTERMTQLKVKCKYGNYN